MKKKEMQYFEALYDAARVVNASLEPAAVLEKIVRCVTEAMNVKACSIRLLDARGKRLLMGAARGLSKGYLVKGPVLIKESGIDRRALAGRTIWIRDARSDRGFQYSAEAKKEKNPLRSGDAASGGREGHRGTQGIHDGGEEIRQAGDPFPRVRGQPERNRHGQRPSVQVAENEFRSAR